MRINMNEVEDFIKELRSKNVVCLLPQEWNKFFLHFEKRLRNKVKLPNPLILGGWYASNDYDKRERFEEHIRTISLHLGLKAVTYYFDRAIKEKDYLISDQIDPSEKSDMEEQADAYNEWDGIVSEAIEPLKRLIEYKPELLDSDELIRFLHAYEEDTGIRCYEDKKLRLVHSNSEVRALATKIYQAYLKTKGLSYWGDLHDFCNHVISDVEEIEVKDRLY